jgi:tetratricopeptide (TPR) repeat protein
MSYHSPDAIKCLSIISAAMILASIQPVRPAHAASIVLGEIEYTRDGRVDEAGRSAIEDYVEFFLSRLHNRKPDRMVEYIRTCAPKESDGSCPLPDFYVELRIDERQGELEISGAVGQKIGPKDLETHNLDISRVKFRDLAGGLSRVLKDVDAIISKSTAPREPAHVVIACFGATSNAPPAFQQHPQAQTRDPAALISDASSYADRLPQMLERLMRDEPRLRVSISKDARADCSLIETLQAVAQTTGAEAVLTGGVFSDDRSGLIVVPQIFITAARKKIALPVISIPSGADVAASYERVAQPLAAVSYALVGSPNRGEFVKAIGDNAELSYYLDRAKAHLSLSPPEYDAADALLELAKSKAPAEQQSYLLLARSLAAQSRYAEASAILRSGIDQVPDGKALHVALADNLSQARDAPQARRVYEAALSANILAEDVALLGIARTYVSGSGRSLEKAMEYALKAAAQNPSSADAYFLAGWIAEAQDNFETAESHYQRARELSPRSAQIASRLSNLYERWKNQDLKKGNRKGAIDMLTKSIEILPSAKKYSDRGFLYFEFYAPSGERSKGYQLASADYTRALQLASEKDTVLSQLPWLMPNLVETLIFEGKFKEAKRLADELFAALASDTSVRPSADPKEIRLIAAFLTAVAQMLDAGSAEKELYLFENTALGMNFSRLTWSFDEMSSFLEHDYGNLVPHLNPDDQAMRVGAVKQWIGRMSKK